VSKRPQQLKITAAFQAIRRGIRISGIIMDIKEKALVIREKRYKGESIVVSLRMPKHLIDNIDKVAEKTGRSRNDIITKSIIFALDNMEIEKVDDATKK
jgi:hypothetical protein